MSLSPVLCSHRLAAPLAQILARYGLQIAHVPPGQAIPGSFWGDSEAGLIGNTLYLRDDTPLHSALHEASHYICMSPQRRSGLHTDAGGGYEEENAVCYLQILLAGQFPGVGRRRMQQDMDTWGYTFRLGSAAAWFEQDAEEAFEWLLQRHIIDNDGQPSWNLHINRSNEDLLAESR
jgi:hypothetical protein